MTDLLFVAGTRPEIIKLAPVILRAREGHRGSFQITLCLTGQHRAMAHQALQMFGLSADDDLDIMTPGQSLHEIVMRVFERLPKVLERHAPDIVVVQGDTTTAAAAAVCAFQSGIRVAHVEAGLRSHDMAAPFPEELNRKLIATCARVHLAPTVSAAENLQREGVAVDHIHVTGNTVVDALQYLVAHQDLTNLSAVDPRIRSPFVLITAHRRESFGGGFESICGAILESARRHSELQFVYPVHLNPNVHGPVRSMLGSASNVLLLDPIPYVQLLTLLRYSAFVLTDSGGIQEEAPSFGKYCIVLRDVTERMESVDLGISELAGADRARIVEAVDRQVRAPRAVDAGRNPYGDGQAADRILRILSGGPEVEKTRAL